MSRTFNETEMKIYAEQKAFEYMNYTVQPPSIWERLSWWFQSILQRFFLNPNTPWLMQIAYYLIILVVLGAAIFYIVRLRYGGGLSTDYQTFQPGVAGVKETKKEDFDQLIDGALQDRNFKLAIRYQYLKSLSILARKELIRLKDWKSPYDYERELEGEIATTYREIARLFEYVWYGDFDAGEGEYQKGSSLSLKLEQAT